MKFKAIFIILIILSLIILSLIVLAKEANTDLAYSWLISKPNTNVFTASFTALAVSRANPVEAQPYISYVLSQKNPTQPCWPGSNCNVKDTSAVLLVESLVGLQSSTTKENIQNWLISKQTKANLPGSWNLQIITPSNGECQLIYEKQNEQPSNILILKVDNGKVTYGTCKDKTFFNLNCIFSSLLDKPSTKLRVRCENDLAAKISLVYIEQNSYYLASEVQQNTAELIVNNGYYGNKENTLYADWSLAESGSNINSLIYLKKNQEQKVLDQAILYLITKNNLFINNLIELQTGFGSFTETGKTPNEFDNAIAALALRESSQQESITLLKSWFGEQQRQDGSWSSDVLKTAAVLYGAFDGGTLPSTSSACNLNGILDQGEQCDGNNFGIYSGTCSNYSSQYTSGNLICTDTCTINTTNCAPSGTTPSSCTISNPRWTNENGEQISQIYGWEQGRRNGQVALLQINGNQNCVNAQISFNVYEDEFGVDPLQATLGPVQFNAQEGSVFIQWQPPWSDDDPLPNVVDNPEFYFKAKIGSLESQNSSLLTVLRPPQIGLGLACSDNIDNDNDGFCDFSNLTSNTVCIDGSTPGDEGCLRFEDNNEEDTVCTPDWSCTPWSPCSSSNTQIRTCRDLNACGVDCNNNPSCITERTCTIVNASDFEPPVSGEDDTTVDADPSDSDVDVCSPNEICEPEWGETAENCPQDCKSKDLIETPDTDVVPKEDEIPEEDLEELLEEERSLFWPILIILLLVLILAGTYFFVLKKPKKGSSLGRSNLPSAPSRPPLFGPKINLPPKTSSPRERKSKIEDELEKSLREAKRLLGK